MSASAITLSVTNITTRYFSQQSQSQVEARQSHDHQVCQRPPKWYQSWGHPRSLWRRWAMWTFDRALSPGEIVSPTRPLTDAPLRRRPCSPPEPSAVKFLHSQFNAYQRPRRDALGAHAVPIVIGSGASSRVGHDPLAKDSPDARDQLTRD